MKGLRIVSGGMAFPHEARFSAMAVAMGVVGLGFEGEEGRSGGILKDQEER